MVRDTRQGWALFAAMSVIFFAGVFVVYPAEQSGNPNLTKLGLEQQATATQPGGNMEGKEVRFGIPNSALFAVVTTDASCGAVNSMHDSFTPLGGMVPLVNIQLGEVVFGGVGAGLYGMLMYAILAVFLAGLMVGRTPEYLGKKIEQKEVKMAMLALLVLAASILLFSAGGMVTHFAKNAWMNPPGDTINNLTNKGPHGLSEILYAYTSGTGNNGSAFAGLSANTPWFNTTLGPGHVDRPVSDDDPLAGHRGQPGAKETGARVRRNLPDSRRSVRGLAGRRHPDCRCADVLPGAFARAPLSSIS